ncbi:hypothetical protein [Arsenophonus nasoniae]|uniref:hypothetical protein n=1 Tax=Arsenophonus nasoniae TaxID=638 RepID=UPI002468CAA6|nr:hypothetical protein [Arsenophonus nasoniae]
MDNFSSDKKPEPKNMLLLSDRISLLLKLYSASSSAHSLRSVTDWRRAAGF